MSTELDQYLNELPIKMVRLVDGSVILAKLIDEDDHTILVQHPYEINLIDNGNILDMALNEYMYLSDDEELTIQKDKILASSDANLKSKDCYSKVILKQKLRKISSRNGFSFGSEIINALFDGLDNQGFSSNTWNKPWPPEEDV